MKTLLETGDKDDTSKSIFFFRKTSAANSVKKDYEKKKLFKVH